MPVGGLLHSTLHSVLQGASLSLHAVANRIIDDYVTEGGQTHPQLAALHLVALVSDHLHWLSSTVLP